MTLLEADLIDAVAAGQDHEPARRRLVELLHGDVLSHLQTEERVHLVDLRGELFTVRRDVGRGRLVQQLDDRYFSHLVGVCFRLPARSRPVGQ